MVSLDRNHLLLWGAVLLAVALLFVVWHQSVTDKVRMDAVISAQNDLLKQAATDRAAHEKADADRDKQYQQDTKDRDAKYQDALKSVQSMASWASRIMNLPVPINVTVPAATPSNPNPAPIVTVPKEDQVPVAQFVHACDQCAADRLKLQADVESRLAQMALADKQIQALKQERDVAVTAAKGGSVMRRFIRATKFVVAGIAIGYVLGKKF